MATPKGGGASGDDGGATMNNDTELDYSASVEYSCRRTKEMYI